MVYLIFDIGNSQIKFGIYENQALLLRQNFKEEEISTKLAVVLKEFNSANKAIISSVKDIPNELFFELKKIKTEFLILDENTKVPIKNLYQNPETLGKDRLAAAIGAKFLFPNTNILIIDAGTAITYDIVTEKGEYLGGNISPGLMMRFKALNKFTGKLPLAKPNIDVPLYGKNTYEAIKAGVQNGILFEMNAFINVISHKFNNLKVVITGGDAFYFENKLKKSIFAEPNLVLLGLNSILEYNA